MDCLKYFVVLLVTLFMHQTFGFDIALNKNAVPSDSLEIMLNLGTINTGLTLNKPDGSSAGNCLAPLGGVSGGCTTGFTQDFTNGVTTFSIASVSRATDEGTWASAHGTDTGSITIKVLTIPTLIVSQTVSALTLSSSNTQSLTITATCAYPAVSLDLYFVPTGGGTAVSSPSSTATCTSTGNAGCADTDAESYDCVIVPKLETSLSAGTYYVQFVVNLAGQYEPIGLNATITDTVITIEAVQRTGHMRVPAMAFLKPRDVSMDCIFLSRPQIHMQEESESILKDLNFLNAAIRKALFVTGIRTIKGFYLNRIITEVKTLVTNINYEDKKLLDALRPKIQNSVRYMRKKQRSPDREYKRIKASNHNLPTDHIQEETVDIDLKSGNLICLKNHQDDPIAKANVVSFPCTDAYIKDQPDLDVKEWVSVMIESKRRNSTIDFIPSRNSTKEWKDVGAKQVISCVSAVIILRKKRRNSFLSWPIHMTDSLAVYEEFTKTMAKEKKKQRGVIRPFQPQPPMPEAVEPQPPMPEAVEPQPPMPEAVEPQPPMPEAVEPQPPMPEAVEPQPPLPEAVEPQPPMPKAVEPQPPMPEAVEPQPPINEEVQPSEVNDDQQDEEEHTACPKPQLDDYVEVAFPVSGKKKQTQLFFGQIVNLDPLTVKFLRKTDKTGFFVWPRREDVSEVEEKEIMKVLPLPTLEGRGKELLVFKC